MPNPPRQRRYTPGDTTRAVLVGTVREPQVRWCTHSLREVELPPASGLNARYNWRYRPMDRSHPTGEQTSRTMNVPEIPIQWPGYALLADDAVEDIAWIVGYWPND